MNIISSDSHVTEPPDTYASIDAKFRDRMPYIEYQEGIGDVYVIPGMRRPVPMGLIAAAGQTRDEMNATHARFEELHRGGWDPDARIADQDRDGIHGEIIYPTIGMAICNHRDAEYKQACLRAYNRWLAEYCSAHPNRLFGIGQTAARTPAETLDDIEQIKKLGLKGLMLPGNPASDEDYDDPIWNPVWEALVGNDLPVSFHVLTTREEHGAPRGSRLNGFLNIIRSNQNLIGLMIFGGVFERYPGLKMVSVEADAGWAAHYMYRMDHIYNRHGGHMGADPLERLPSDYFKENVYLTFQDDWIAFETRHLLNPRRLMWANDFPHSDSTWPWSQELLAKHTKDLSDEEKRWILHDNVAELYGLE